MRTRVSASAGWRRSYAGVAPVLRSRGAVLVQAAARTREIWRLAVALLVDPARHGVRVDLLPPDRAATVGPFRRATLPIDAKRGQRVAPDGELGATDSPRMALGSTVDLRGELEMAAFLSDLVSVRALLEEQVKREVQLKQRIQERMSSAAIR
jgi:hypothetical protein